MLVSTAMVIAAERIEVERDELDRGVDADVPKVRRVTELKNVLANSQVGQRRRSARSKRRLMLRPERALVRVLAEPVAHERDGAVDELVVELDALDRVALAAAPVARLEALAARGA